MTDPAAHRMTLDQILDGYRDTYPLTLTTEQAAAMLSVSAETLRTRVKAGDIPAYRWGKNYRYFRDELIDWLREQPGS